MGIKISAIAHTDLDTIWNAWTNPRDIIVWNTASDDWHTTRAEVDLRVGGKFLSRMEAKDGSVGFDFSGTFTNIIDRQLIEYRMEDLRNVHVEFDAIAGGVCIVEVFDPEDENPLEFQEQGWQSILNNFVKYVESKK